MPIDISIALSPENAYHEESSLNAVLKKAGLGRDDISGYKIRKKSVDARNRNIKINLTIRLFKLDEIPETPAEFNLQDVSGNTPVIVIGAGPGGLFAALRLIELGLKPVILERGQDVRKRKVDIAEMFRCGTFNTESNYAFGEGGAGTFSDGKLYTRSKKRGDIERVLELFVLHGASPEILYESHPHLGSDKLPSIISRIRQTIIDAGGEIHFGCRVSGFSIEGSKLIKVKSDAGDFTGAAYILATGHSARDIYTGLHTAGVELEAKPFAMGLRIEHPQRLIDEIQYHRSPDIKYLPAASYSLVTQASGKGVYSFCMCPGGIIVPASTAAGECVVNGMSSSQRNTRFANSGMVTEIRLDEVVNHESNPLAGMEFQKSLELESGQHGQQGLMAPAQRLTDFINGKTSAGLPETSFIPGTISTNFSEWLPGIIYNPLKEAFTIFGKKMRGFLTSEAVLLGVESRTSSPIRIPRTEDLNHPQIRNLYPCGEGAGFAGGIVSSAVDGIRCAESVSQRIL